MASNQDQDLLQCSGCRENLNFDSKTLPCFHSFCRPCLDRNFEGQTSGNDQCPECHEPLRLDRLSLSPFLIKSLRRLQLETTELKCDLCSGKGRDSTAKYWCHKCQEVFCIDCNGYHETFKRKHNARELDGMETNEMIRMIKGSICSLHQIENDSYCESCNVCLCKTCYQNHLPNSPECSSRPLPVREAASKQRLQAPSLAEKMNGLEMSLRGLNEKMSNYQKELNSDRDLKCKQLWLNFEGMVKNARQKTNEFCEEVREITAKQVKRWRHLTEENDKILKKLEIWRIHLQSFLNEPQNDVDVLCGLRSLGSKLSNQLRTSVGPEEMCQLNVEFSNWWLQMLEQLKSENIGSVSLTLEKLHSEKNIAFENQWILRGSNSYIHSIYVSKEDNHIFVCDGNKLLIDEYTGEGEHVCECILSVSKSFKRTNKFCPFDICSIPPGILVVACGEKTQLIYLNRRKSPPLLKIKTIIKTKENFYSLCQMNEVIFACDGHFKIVSFTKEGEKINTIKTGESFSDYRPLIRADSSTGNLWLTKLNSTEIFCFNPNEGKSSVKSEIRMFNFSVDEFGWFCYCNYKGIFSLSSKKYLYEFEEESEVCPAISISRERIFVYLQIDGKPLINIFKILD